MALRTVKSVATPDKMLMASKLRMGSAILAVLSALRRSATEIDNDGKVPRSMDG